MDTSSTYSPGFAPTYKTPEFDFFFDIVCPYAYIASTRLPQIASHTGAKVSWKPVLLGGLYDLTEAKQGKDGSATSVMPPAKKEMLQLDFQREAKRYQVPVQFHPQHPLRTVDAQRLLCAFPDEYRPLLAQSLYKEYWVNNANINSRATLLRIARSLKLTSIAAPTHPGPFSLNPNLPFTLDESVFSDEKWDQQLRANTQEAFSHGAFGVPAFWIPSLSTLYWGQDRMHLLEMDLIAIKLSKPAENIKQLERLHPRCLRTPREDKRVRTLKFWFDFSSPWAYLGWTQLERLQRDSGLGLKIVYKPFLLGALFKQIGTPLVPMAEEPEIKQAYIRKDLQDWVKYWSAVNSQEYPPIDPVKFQWPSKFPINSVLALRLAIVEPAVIPIIYKAAWGDDVDVSDEKTLEKLLDANGFEAGRLLKNAKAESTKSTLRANTDEAVKNKFCGAPTYQISNQTVWGQDRLNVVQDLVQGWKPEVSKLKASVASFHKFDYRL